MAAQPEAGMDLPRGSSLLPTGTSQENTRSSGSARPFPTPSGAFQVWPGKVKWTPGGGCFGALQHTYLAASCTQSQRHHPSGKKTSKTSRYPHTLSSSSAVVELTQFTLVKIQVGIIVPTAFRPAGPLPSASSVCLQLGYLGRKVVPGVG